MKFPKWFPSIPRPWNPAYRDTWDAMSKGDRQMSFLIDLVMVATLIGVVVAVSGCAKTPGGTDTPGQTASAPGDTSPATRDTVRPYVPPRSDVPVYVDPETGCQYLGYSRHGLTPRVESIGGSLTHKGCRSK